MARSAFLSRVSLSAPWSGNRLTPMLQVRLSTWPWTWNSPRSTRLNRSTAAAAREVGPGLINANINSSPPAFATVSWARVCLHKRSPTCFSSKMPTRVPRGVINVFEVTRMEPQYGHPFLAAASIGQRLGQPVFEKHPIGQAGQVIVIGQEVDARLGRLEIG